MEFPLVSRTKVEKENESDSSEEFNSESEIIQRGTVHTSIIDRSSVLSLSRIRSTFKKLRTKKSQDDDDTKNAHVLKKEITLFSAIAYVVGSTIGSGIFITPKHILCSTGSFGLSMIVWTLGGVVAMAGGLCYVELALLIRKSGAEYSYLKTTYSFKKKYKILDLLGSLLAFLYIWSSISISKSSSLAILSLTCAQYLVRPFFIDCSSDLPKNAVKLLALAIILTLILINCYSLKLSTRVMSVFTVTKLLAVAFIVIIGIIFMISHRGNFSEGFIHPFVPIEGKQINVFTIGQSFYSVLWAYDGWNVISYIFEETRNVDRTVPVAIFIGIPLITISYLLVNLSFFAVLPYDQILSSEAVALPFGTATIGTAGLVIIPLLVSISTFGTANSSVYQTSRIAFVAAREGELPDFLSGLHVTVKTPISGIILQGLIGMFLVIVGTLDQLIEAYTFLNFVFYTLTISAVVILRVTHREKPRIFKVWFIVPIAVSLVCFCLFIVFIPLATAPISPLVAIGYLLIGVFVYIFLAMETPWKLRPKIMDKCSEFLSKVINNTLNSKSTRGTL